MALELQSALAITPDRAAPLSLSLGRPAGVRPRGRGSWCIRVWGSGGSHVLYSREAVSDTRVLSSNGGLTPYDLLLSSVPCFL